MTARPAAHVRLAAYCTLGVGGPAKRFSSPTSSADLVYDLRTARDLEIPVTILGGGSNMVFHDEGFHGWVIRPNLQSLAFEERAPDDIRVHADAGVSWDHLVKAATQKNLVGIEAMSGIPGNVGAAPIQNIGAYGQELSHILRSVRAYDRENDKIVILSSQDCAFGYRDSRFKRDSTHRYVIMGVELSLRKAVGEIPLGYKDLTAYFGAQNAPDVRAVRHAVREIRRRKGMVYDPSDVNSHSVGSFFMNPVVDDATRDMVFSKAEAMGYESMPHYLQEDGRWKLSAAWLISRAGIERGYRLGGAQISPLHVLAIIHPGGGSSRDVRRLARHVQQRVQEVWGIRLIPEARIMTPTGLDTSFYLGS